MVRNFRHVCLITRNLDKSLKFYRDILGLKVSKILTVEGGYPETALNIKGIRLTYVKMRSPRQPRGSPPVFELHYWERPRMRPEKPGYNHISFTVDDIDRVYKRLHKAGVRCVSRPVKAPEGVTKIFFGYDPDGNLIEFVEELKK